MMPMPQVELNLVSRRPLLFRPMIIAALLLAVLLLAIIAAIVLTSQPAHHATTTAWCNYCS